MSEEKIILFDGVCNLCNGFVNFVIKRDPNMKFRFAALQSAVAQTYLNKFQLPAGTLDSVVLIAGGQAYRRSGAALKIIKELGALWPVLYIFIVLPTPIRDFLYNAVAKRRYRWFGQRDQCMMPTPDIQKRFL